MEGPDTREAREARCIGRVGFAGGCRVPDAEPAWFVKGKTCELNSIEGKSSPGGGALQTTVCRSSWIFSLRDGLSVRFITWDSSGVT